MRSSTQNLLFLILVGVWIMPMTSCIPEDALQNLVVTEDVIYLSGEKVRLTGRVIEVNGSVVDHGFYLSTDDTFNDPIIVSLNEKTNGLGRFIGAYEFLNIGTSYYYKSFANIDGDVVFGQIKSFSTLKPRIDKFSPLNGVEGTTVTLTGVNFTNDTKIFIDQTEVPIVALENESSIEVKMPAIIENAQVDISVMVQDTTMTFQDKFTYHFGVWKLETKFPDNSQLYESMFLTENNKFIFGLGIDASGNLNPNIWSLNLDTYDWTDLNFAIDAAKTRSPFNAGSYWGAGLIGFLSGGHSAYFWKYSLGTFELKPFLTFRLYKSIGMSLNGRLYVFGGELPDRTNNTSIYMFDELANSWDIKSESPFQLSNTYPYFVYGNKAYFLLPDGRIINYDPSLDQWNEVGEFPANIGENGVAIEINGKALIGLFDQEGRMWEWDIELNSWTMKNEFTGNFRDVNNGFFKYNEKAYFFRSKSDGGKFDLNPQMELWSLDPVKLK